MQRPLAVLLDRLLKIYEQRLISMILYGSAAGRDFHDGYSDLNVMCVISRIAAADLAVVEPVVRWWRDQANPSPLLMTESELAASARVFPIEFNDMRARRQVLHGADPIAALPEDNTYYKAQVEHELQAKLFRLRQQASGIMSNRDALLRLCLESVSTFLNLGRHALRASGKECRVEKREIVTALRRELGGGGLAEFETLLDVRERRAAPQEVDPATLLEKYLVSIERLLQLARSL